MSGGQYLMLFMVALLLLWLAENPEKREFRQFALLMLLALLCPLSVKLLSVYQTAFYQEENLWELLPVTALLAYGLVTAFAKMKTALTREYGRWKSAVTRKKELFCELAVTAVLTALLFLCGTLSLNRTMTASADGAERIPERVEEVLASIEVPEGESVFLLAPDEVLTWARIYDGALLLPYGRNLWEGELSAYTYDVYSPDLYELHDWMNDPGGLADADIWTNISREEQFLSRCASAGYDYLVFSLERSAGEALQKALSIQREYVYAAETESYVIYRLQ